MSKTKLVARLRWYYPTEKLNAFLFTGVIIYVLYAYDLVEASFLLYGLTIMVFILFQGQHYWKLKLYKLTKKTFDQRANLELFRKAEKVNFVLIGLIPVVFIIQWLMAGQAMKKENLMGWGMAANAMGVLEHINYYHRQLMIDNLADLKYLMTHKRLKRASLRKDLEENEL